MPRAPMTQALRGRLALTGVLREGGVTRSPKRRRCPHCGDVVVMVIDPLFSATVAVLDVVPTTTLGEVLVVLARAGTCYRLGRTWADARIGIDVLGRVADQRAVHPPHVCGSRWPAHPTFPAFSDFKVSAHAPHPDDPIPF